MDQITPDDQYFLDRFNTQLSAEDEAGYQAWTLKNNRVNDAIDYDMRGAWKSGATQSDNGHFPDKFKKPNHPTFSDQSIYHGALNEAGGKYLGGTWSTDETGHDVYTPSAEMLNTTHDAKSMKKYFADREPNAVLILPKN